MIREVTLYKFAGESDIFYLNCSEALADSESITGSVVLSQLPADLVGADALSFGVAVVNVAALQFPDGNVGRIGSVIMVRIAGGTPASDVLERTYTVVATFDTDQGNTKVVRGRLLLLPLAL